MVFAQNEGLKKPTFSQNQSIKSQTFVQVDMNVTPTHALVGRECKKTTSGAPNNEN